ncbi:MAG: hypothetical protein AAF401_14610, partial [Pseudomonadota bacterium]
DPELELTQRQVTGGIQTWQLEPGEQGGCFAQFNKFDAYQFADVHNRTRGSRWLSCQLSIGAKFEP